MGEDKQLAESLPAGLITMLLTGYLTTIIQVQTTATGIVNNASIVVIKLA